ncbi:MAG: hypothetical protein ACYSSO_15515 [Planctomycetota bacterium]
MRVSSGHHPALWYHKDSKRIEELPNTGIPISLMEKASFEQTGLKTADAAGLADVIGLCYFKYLPPN